MVRAAMRNLRSADVRHRRRAVRRLFEINDPVAIQAFEPLLDDSDEWFRVKAIQAIGIWARPKDLELIQRLAISERVEFRMCAARIANRAGKSCKPILSKLCQDEVAVVRNTAWATKFSIAANLEEVNRDGMENESSGIRLMAIQSMRKMEKIDGDLLYIGLIDSSKKVQANAVSLLRSHPDAIESELDDLLIDIVENNHLARKDAIIFLIENSSNNDIISSKLPNWMEDGDFRLTKAIISAIEGKDWKQLGAFTQCLETTQNETLIVGSLRRNYSIDANKLRNSIIADTSRESSLRTRLIEELIGSTKVDETTIEIIKNLKNSDDEFISKIAGFFIEDIESRH
jgi:hypothetical protein